MKVDKTTFNKEAIDGMTLTQFKKLYGSKKINFTKSLDEVYELITGKKSKRKDKKDTID